MNKLSKEKKSRLILVGVGTLALLAMIIYAVILPQYAAVAEMEKKIDAAHATLKSMEDEIKNQEATKTEVHDVTTALSQAESDVAYGDPIAWFYETMRNFKGRYKVDISVTSQSSIGEVDLLPQFPYKQLKVTVGGTAFYHDLGKFIADFENAFPHTRVVNLSLEVGGNGDNAEKLNFRMDIIALVKTAETQN